jgi:hypothetical protein
MPARLIQSDKRFGHRSRRIISQMAHAREKQVARVHQGSRGSAHNHTSVAGVRYGFFEDAAIKLSSLLRSTANTSSGQPSKVSAEVFFAR